MKSANQPIPGATVTATVGTQKIETTTGENGSYTLLAVPAGDCVIEVRMFGFEPITKKANCAEGQKIDFTLQMQESPMAQRLARMGGAQGGGNELATQLESEINAPQTTPGAAPGTTDGQNGNEAFLVSGSLSQGLAQNARPDFGMYQMGGPGMPGGPGGVQFGAQGVPGGAPGGGFGGGPGGGFGGGRGGFGGNRGRGGPGGPGAQFGNRRAPSQIHGMAFFTLGNSVLDAKPFSINGENLPQPAYASSRFGFLLGGPLIIPKIVKAPSTFFYLNYTGTRARAPYSAVETVPTEAEREGNFSQATVNGAPVTIFNPATNQPFAFNNVNNVIPPNMINPIAQKLLSYVPLPNQPGLLNNYQYVASPANNTDNLGARVMRNVGKNDRLAYHLTYQRRDSDLSQPFAFLDMLSGYGIQTDLTWTHNFTPTTILSSQLSFNRNRNETTPYFANGADVAADLGIARHLVQPD